MRSTDTPMSPADVDHTDRALGARGDRAVVEYSVVPAASGDPTLYATLDHGRQWWVHSRFDPRREGQELAGSWADGKALYIVLGIGLGYHVKALADRVPDEAVVLAVEPDARLFGLSAGTQPVRDLSQHRNVIVVSGTEVNLTETLLGINLASFPSIRIHVHPGLSRLAPDSYRRWEESIRAGISRYVLNTATLVHWDLTWLENTLRNLDYALAASPVRLLFNQFRGTPAFIISAGPSLDRNIDNLKDAQGKSLIIGIGQTLRTLGAHGIRPDIVLSYDAGYPNYRHFEGVAYDDIPLGFDPMIYPRILQEHAGPKWVMATTSNPYLWWLEEATGSLGLVASGGSVATVALDFAARLGCNPVVLVGQDLAYSGDRTHAEHVASSGEPAPRTDREGTERLRVPGVCDEFVWTSRVWYGFLTWFEQYIAKASDRLTVIDATEGGALIRGSLPMTLREAVSSTCRTRIDVRDRLASLSTSRSTADLRRSVVRYALGQAERLEELKRTMRSAARYAADTHDALLAHGNANARVRRLMSKLDDADKAYRRLRTEHPRLIYTLQQAAYRVSLETLRGAEAHGSDLDRTRAVLERSQRLYEGISEAAERMCLVIRSELGD